MTMRSISIRTRDGRDDFPDDEHTLRLRHRILKLRWIGYEAEATARIVRRGRSGHVSEVSSPLETLGSD